PAILRRNTPSQSTPRRSSLQRNRSGSPPRAAPAARQCAQFRAQILPPKPVLRAGAPPVLSGRHTQTRETCLSPSAASPAPSLLFLRASHHHSKSVRFAANALFLSNFLNRDTTGLGVCTYNFLSQANLA